MEGDSVVCCGNGGGAATEAVVEFEREGFRGVEEAIDAAIGAEMLV